MADYATNPVEPLWGSKSQYGKPEQPFCDPGALSPKAKRLLGIGLAFSLKTGKFPSKQTAATLMRTTTEAITFWELELRRAGLHVSFPAMEG